jgi:hypothetical protein
MNPIRSLLPDFDWWFLLFPGFVFWVPGIPDSILADGIPERNNFGQIPIVGL